MKHKLFTILVCLVFLTAAAVLLQAQTSTTGQVRGVVKDPTGAVISGAKVTLTSPAGEQRDTATDAEGHFRFVLLPPAKYQVAAESSGFKPTTLSGVAVTVTETTDLSVSLGLAGTAESVNISAELPLVQTSSATAGRVIGDTQIRQLPLPTRNFQQLLTLSPGTVANLSNNTEMGRGDVTVDVNGQRGTSNNVVVDGTEVNSPGTNSTPNISVPSPDSIQEFIVQTSLFDATQGRNAGGNIAVVTKSGTNGFHGSAYEFLRNRVLNANDFFLNSAGRPRPVLTRNQFGATFGGPIIKDKTFFFVSYQGTRERNGASLTNSLSFPNIPSGLTNDRSDAALNTLATQFGVAAISPITKKLLQAKLPNGNFAVPSAAGTGALPTTLVLTPMSGVSRFTEDQFSVNIDQNIGQKNKLSGKFFFSDTPQFQSQFSFVGSNPLQIPGYGGFIDFHNRLLTISDTHIFNPNLINQARVGYSRINGPSRPEEPFKNSDFGINNPLCAANPNFCGLATIQVLGLFSIGSTTLADQKSTTQTFQWSDMVSYTHGRHFLRFGGEARRYRVDFFFNFFSRGQVNFNTFKDFLAGNIALGLLGNGVHDRGMRATDADWFIQDDFRVNDRLTLNFGMRLERNGGISEIRNRLVNFDPKVFAQNSLPCTIAAPCTANNGFHILTPGETLNPSTIHAAPRFGFSWKPMRDKNNLVVRGGFGVYFDRFSTRVANLQIFNYPFDIVGIGLGSFVNPFPDLSTTTFPVSPAVIPSPVPFYFAGIPLSTARTPISGIYVDKNFRTPYVYQYNLGFQYEPAKDWLVEMAYVGSAGRKLINIYTYNQGALGTAPYNVPALGAAGATAMFSSNKVLNGFQTARTDANSNYNSLQASVTKRFSKGLQFLASYTWSKSIDDISGAPTNEFAAVAGDQQSRLAQHGLSDFDRRHRFVFSGVYDLPKFYKGNSGVAQRLANQWEMSGVMTIQTGAPFSVVCTSGSALFNRADVISGVSPTIGGSVNDKLNKYFNTAAFAATCTNTAPYGTSARNTLRGPDQRDVDFSLIKFIPLTESTKLEFRTEFFNAFNTVNFANPQNNVLVPGTLGKITSATTGPRVIQFALKLSF
jgi:hypothetical protein